VCTVYTSSRDISKLDETEEPYQCFLGCEVVFQFPIKYRDVCKKKINKAPFTWIVPSDLGVFGASMAGACIGFLVHNRYKAKVFMGDTGSLALGGGLAAMAACSGMFFPLFIASGIFVIETVSVIAQVSTS
jgi:UDP-N-acetylmuramyl pentapeptide phosphotransferase/UDP-N-acetylglucosamine-1-phosphate transferase